MKILLAHNRYQQRGGEDSVFEAEIALLAANGCLVFPYLRDNERIDGLVSRVKAAFSAVFSEESKKEMLSFLIQNKVDIAHIHNFFPVLTPSIYDACISESVPVVQTLHNYRTICPGALLMREGQICEDCLTGTPYQAVLHSCYRNSRLGTLAVSRMVDYHRKCNTWGNMVDRFIALTEFSKGKFVEAGFPAHKIAVKPNFYSGKGVETHSDGAWSRSGALFVGRISPEKGIHTLVKAWAQIDVSLRLVGGGALLDDVQRFGLENISCVGQLNAEEVSSEMTKAAFLVMPSEWYEGFPMVLVEAFAHGLPVIASRLGAMAEIVEEGVTGLHFEAGNAADLAAKVRWLNEHPDECRQMGYNARREFEEKYTPQRNYDLLMKIYQEAIDEHQTRR